MAALAVSPIELIIAVINIKLIFTSMLWIPIGMPTFNIEAVVSP